MFVVDMFYLCCPCHVFFLFETGGMAGARTFSLGGFKPGMDDIIFAFFTNCYFMNRIYSKFLLL